MSCQPAAENISLIIDYDVWIHDVVHRVERRVTVTVQLKSLDQDRTEPEPCLWINIAVDCFLLHFYILIINEVFQSIN